MNKSKWRKYVPYVLVLVIGLGGGFVGKAFADGSITSYVGCSLPK